MYKLKIKKFKTTILKSYYKFYKLILTYKK